MRVAVLHTAQREAEWHPLEEPAVELQDLVGVRLMWTMTEMDPDGEPVTMTDYHGEEAHEDTVPPSWWAVFTEDGTPRVTVSVTELTILPYSGMTP